MAITRETFPLPDVSNPFLAPFFDGAAKGELLITRCRLCDVLVWYPEESCPTCSNDLEWVQVSGRATLFSWAVVRRPFLPAFEDMVPFVTALVALDEDPHVRLCSFIVDVDPEPLSIDSPVEVVFRPLQFATVPGQFVIVPMFKPAEM